MTQLSVEEINAVLGIIDSTLMNCSNILPKLKEGSSSYTLNQNRIKALIISKNLLMQTESTFPRKDLENAIIQIKSIKNKSTTGLNNAKANSGTYTRFLKLINSMNVVLEYLNSAMNDVQD
ncbi:MAG: hypothetical protein JXR88_02390 [Clostridia bacterium]|nr:hypothetical protein [Clostridia bacterium]